MKFKTLFIAFSIFLALFAGGLYYTTNYAYYDYFEYDAHAIETDFGEIRLHNVQMIDGDHPALKLRICADAVDGIEREASESATPLVAPKWFSCFDAKALGDAIDEGQAQAYVIRSNAPFGFDTYLANYNGHAFVWRQLNECGEAKFEGLNLPEGCEAEESK